MPLLVSCSDLQPGMRLAEAFLFKGRTMLPGGKMLGEDDVQVLRRKYPDITLKIGDPVLDSVVNFEDDSKEREIAATVTTKISTAMADVQKRFSHHTDLSGINFQAMRNQVSSVVDFLKDNPVSMALLNPNASSASYFNAHAGNVFYLCMVLGSAVRDYVVRERQRQTSAQNLTTKIAIDLLPLGLGAMFIDVAMYPLEHILEPGYELTDDDRTKIREHPNAGADLIPDNLPPAVKMVVRTHHENFDGSGYPARKTGASLHIFTRIVRICDAFDAATSEKFYKGAKSTARVLWEMSLGTFRNCYDPVLMKVFCGIIQPFPIGAKLKLSDNRTAVVVKYNRKQPFQPTVVIAFDEHGERYPVDKLVGPLNVGEDNDLRIQQFAEEPMAYLYEGGDSTPVFKREEMKLDNILEACFP